MPRLTKRQQELLEAMKAGVEVIYMRYMGRFNPNAYYFRADTHARCTQAADRLLALGLVEKIDRTAFGDHRLRFKQPTP